ncbi:MAG: holo-ACP synthase [Ignavibacteriaceae bacterium]|nr:holo-ACP synthase [Ignavibacteriaceae bacterium]
MVIGIGVDIIEIDRIRSSIEKFGDSFLRKIFTDGEIEYCRDKGSKYTHYAGRFAAKEAVYKALSEFIPDLWWKDIEVVNDDAGRPSIRRFGKIQEFLGENYDLKISISHSHRDAVCYAILQNKT